MTSFSPLRVRGALEKMVFLAIESLDAASPLLAVHTAHRIALEVRFHVLELSVRVMVCRTRHNCDRGGEA